MPCDLEIMLDEAVHNECLWGRIKTVLPAASVATARKADKALIQASMLVTSRSDICCRHQLVLIQIVFVVMSALVGGSETGITICGEAILPPTSR
jgi:hypothetical protein